MNWSKSRKVLLTGCRVIRTFVLAKRRRQIISSMLALLLLESNAQAQTQTQTQSQTQTQTQAGDWQAVVNLKPGTRISLKAQHHILCVFQAATDDELVCKPKRFLWLGPRESRFDRQSIREVRLERNQTKDMLIGTGIGTGAGAIAGATTGKAPRGGSLLVLTLGGSLVGSVVGGIVSIPLRGKIIYKR